MCIRDRTSCQGISFDWIGVGNSGSTSGAEENGGVFSSGTYDYTVWDTYGDSLNGGAGIYFETRAAGSSGAWTTVQSETGYIGSSGRAGSITVATGDEMRLAYHCPYSGSGSSCWSQENYVTITKSTSIPPLPAAAAGRGPAAPAASEPADVIFSIPQGQEAYLSYTTGTSAQDAEETVVYYRVAGSSGWSTLWDVCTGAACAGATTYTSEASVLFQHEEHVEVLVWDTACLLYTSPSPRDFG